MGQNRHTDRQTDRQYTSRVVYETIILSVPLSLHFGRISNGNIELCDASSVAVSPSVVVGRRRGEHCA